MFIRRYKGLCSYTRRHLLIDLQQFRSHAFYRRRTIVWLASLAVLLPGVVQGAEVRGKVSNASGGEALGQVQVQVVQSGSTTITAENGTFQIQNLDPGAYTLRLNAAGFRL